MRVPEAIHTDTPHTRQARPGPGLAEAWAAWHIMTDGTKDGFYTLLSKDSFSYTVLTVHSCMYSVGVFVRSASVGLNLAPRPPDRPPVPSPAVRPEADGHCAFPFVRVRRRPRPRLLGWTLASRGETDQPERERDGREREGERSSHASAEPRVPDPVAIACLIVAAGLLVMCMSRGRRQ